MNDDAEERFFLAGRALEKAEQAARSDLQAGNPNDFKKAVIDLDAAIPGLEGLSLARAKLLKAHALWWMYFLGLRTNHPKFYDPTQPEDPLLAESHALAVEGRKLLKRFKAPSEDLEFADDLVAKTE